MVQVDFNGDGHKIANAWLVDQDLPANFHIKGRSDDIKFDLLDDKNKVISSSYANSPAPIYGAYILATEQEKKQLNHNAIPNKKGSYYLRVPQYQKHMKSIQLSYIPKVEKHLVDQITAETVSARVVNKAYSLAVISTK